MIKHMISQVKPTEIEGTTVLTFYCPCCDKWLYISHSEDIYIKEFFGHPKEERKELEKRNAMENG